MSSRLTPTTRSSRSSRSTPTTSMPRSQTRCPLPRRRSGRPRETSGRSSRPLRRRSTVTKSARCWPDWFADHRRVHVRVGGRLTGVIAELWTWRQTLAICIETVHRSSPRRGDHPSARTGPTRDGFDAEWREIDLLMVEGDLITAWSLRRGRPRRRAREVRRASARSAAAGKRGKPGVRALLRRTSRPVTGTRLSEVLADDYYPRRSSSGGECRDPTRSGCRDRQNVRPSPTSGSST